MTEDIVVIARDLKLPPEKVQHAVELLDAGNTIPFIARFRKDQTGGLDPEQVLAIKQRVGQLRALAERKTFVLKSIESQGSLTEQLANEIRQASSGRRVEDLYLPFKAKKQTLALTARQQGLEPFAEEIISGTKTESELAARALDFVRVDKGLSSVDEVMNGVGYLIAEKFSERSDVRRELRRMIWGAGSLSCKSARSQDLPAVTKPGDEKPADSEDSTTTQALAAASRDLATSDDVPAPLTAIASLPAESIEPTAITNAADVGADSIDHRYTEDAETHGEHPDGNGEDEAGDDSETAADEAGEDLGIAATAGEGSAVESSTGESATAETGELQPSPTSDGSSQPSRGQAATGKGKGTQKKAAKTKPAANPFADYEDFSESLKKIPNHRILAINRGERAGLLKARVKADQAGLEAKLFEMLIPGEHPSRTFLTECARDAFSRLIFPSLEREVRRELTETAEQHALRVFSENLKALLLQPPIRGKRILAVDPGYKSGCAVAILDEQGAVLQTEKLFVVGNQTRRGENRAKLATLVKQHQVALVAIGNGTACREAEQLVSDAIKLDLADRQVRYVIVNEAGTSTYSTSEIGKEELPSLPAGARCAVSIGRRLLDPLSELVKISPANLGVGLYQHDIKAKHLAESLEEVVEACVNHVGVNINTASVALLRHIAGLNQLTARRLLEQRSERPFSNRQQLREVSGIGDATFVQAAGFLRIFGGDQPLDETAIHPESYPLAERILAKIGWTVADWAEWRRSHEPRRNPEPPTPTPAVAAPQNLAAQPGSPESIPAESTTPEPGSAPTLATSETALATTDPALATVETGATLLDSAGSSPATEAASEAAANETTSEQASVATGAAESVQTVPSQPVPLPVAIRGEDLAANTPPRQPHPLGQLNAADLAREFQTGELLIKDILEALQRPTLDPRNKNLGPVFRSGIIKLEDLQPEMRLDSQIVNVVDFGVFVDVGLGYSCLVHVSELSRGFVRDLHQQFAVGDVLTTWVKEIDAPRRRVKLTAIPPGTKKFERRRKPAEGEAGSEEQRRERGPRGDRPPRGERPQRSEQAGARGDRGAAGRSPGDRGPRGQRSDRPNQGADRGQRSSRGPRPGGPGSRAAAPPTSSAPPKMPRRPSPGKFERRPIERPSKPKPVKPISEDMLSGDKPMRSFSDLAQFFHKKKPDDEQQTN